MKRLLRGLRNPTLIISCLVLLVAHNGYLMLSPVLSRILHHAPEQMDNFHSWQGALSFLEAMDIPRFMVGVALICMALTLLMRTRIAWFSSVMLLVCIILVNLFLLKGHQSQVIYAFITLAALLYHRRHFYKHSLGSTSLFAIISILSLIAYGMLGTLYLGDQFTPPVKDLPTAFYFVMVCMSTVGFGDISPHTTLARMFTLTVISLGITIFAASVASIAGSLISHNIQRLIKGRFSHVIRKNHYIIAGSSALAQSVTQGLTSTGGIVTVVCNTGNAGLYPSALDVIEGDPSSTSTLEEAGAADARYIVALMDNDADNAFVVLAAKEAGGKETKTIALVNDSQNMSKIKRVHPDGVLSLQQLGSDILVRTLNGDAVDCSLTPDIFFNHVQTPSGNNT